jgi:hypothetical protein
VVYDRRQGGQELSFEASGALKDASLVMRDRETDSWWSIMSSDAIGGDLDGADLVELPIGEKTTWGDWAARFPGTLVLSVDGREHDPNDYYADYFASSETFRGIASRDPRLPAKEPIFAFHHLDRPWAIPHQRIFGGLLMFVAVPGMDEPQPILFHRQPGSAMFASTRAWLVAPAVTESSRDPQALLQLAERGDSGFEPLAGFDTFWYMWANVNRETSLLD